MLKIRKLVERLSIALWSAATVRSITRSGSSTQMLPRDHLAVSYGSATHYSRETQ